MLLQEKESTIRQQQQVILSLSRALNTTQTKQETVTLTEKSKLSRDEEVEKKGKQNGTDDESTLKKGDKFLGSLTTSSKSDPESLNDSDSAIMLEDNFDSLVVIPLGKGEVKVVRSVSDAVEVANRSSCSSSTSVAGGAGSLLKPGFSNCTGPGSLSTSPSCSSEESDDSPSCTLTKGRAELLRTVYSLEEEEVCHTLPEHDVLDDATSVAPSLQSILKVSSHYDSDATLSDGESEEEEDESSRQTDDSSNDRRQLLGSFEKLNTLGATPVRVKAEEEIQVTYNRVMSNHRSVTKPKDVKYRRINKAKSRSLEELRGKLKYWTDRGGKQSLSVDLDNHSFA